MNIQIKKILIVIIMISIIKNVKTEMTNLIGTTEMITNNFSEFKNDENFQKFNSDFNISLTTNSAITSLNINETTSMLGEMPFSHELTQMTTNILTNLIGTTEMITNNFSEFKNDENFQKFNSGFNISLTTNSEITSLNINETTSMLGEMPFSHELTQMATSISFFFNFGKFLSFFCGIFLVLFLLFTAYYFIFIYNY